MVRAVTVVSGNILDAFFSPGSSVRSSALRASAAHNFYYRNGDRGEIVSCQKRNLELFKLQHKTGAAMIYSSNNGTGATKNE